MPSLNQGRVVYVRKLIYDPQGRNPKANRPFIVLTKNEDIAGQQTIQGIGITDELHLSPADHYFILPDGPARFKHGCKSGSAALFTFIRTLDIDDLDWGSGCIIGKTLHDLLEELKAFKEKEQKQSDANPPS